MNAYELADKLIANLTREYDCDDYMETASVMLRQQADRIADLETTLAFKKRKPLNEDEIKKILLSNTRMAMCVWLSSGITKEEIEWFVSEVEQAHGIK